MCRPYRRFCFHLAERLGRTVQQLQNELTGNEITEWMAFDLTCKDDWVKKYQKDIELEKSKEMSAKERVSAFKALFGGVMKRKS